MSSTDKEAMDVDVNDAEIEEEIDEFNDNEEGLVSGMPGVEEEESKNTTTTSARPLIPELPELTRKDKSLKEVLSMMDDYSPIIPDAVTEYLMAKNGLQINDLNIKRLLALATQKFISDIAQDAYEYSRIRSNTVNKLKNTLNSNQVNQLPGQLSQQGQAGGGANAGGGASGANAGGASGGGGGASGGSNPNNEKLTLTVEDLSSALEEHGVNIRRPNFYR